jgi:hypothetical protein
MTLNIDALWILLYRLLGLIGLTVFLFAVYLGANGQLKHEAKMLTATTLIQFLAGYAQQWDWAARKVKELRGWKESELERWRMTPELRRWVYKTYGSWCLKHLKEGVYVFGGHIDHVVSIYNNGKTVKRNLQPLCQTCNLKKGTKNADYRDKIYG